MFQIGRHYTQIFQTKTMANVMKSIFKVLIVLIVLLILIVGIGMVAVSHFVKPEHVKPLIIEKVQQETGRKLTLAGDLKWCFLPSLGIEVQKATLSNAKGFGEQPFATVGEAHISLQIFPLIIGKVEIDTLSLKNVTFNLAKNKNGVTNWADLIKDDGHTKPIDSPAVVLPAAAAQTIDTWEFNIPKIDIQNVNIHWDDAVTGTKTSIRNLNLEAQHIQNKKPFLINLSMSVDNKTPSVRGQVTLSSKITLSDPHYALDKPALSIQLKGKSLPQGQLNAKFSAQKITINPNDAHLQKIALALNDTHVTGDMNIEDFKKGTGQFNLNVDQINVDEWLATAKHFSEAKTTDTTTKEAAQKPEEEFNLLALLYPLDLQGKIAIGSLKVARIRAQKITANLKTKKGILNISPIKALAYGGNMKSDVIVDANHAQPQFNVNAAIRNIQLCSFLKDLINQQKISGTANLTLKVTAQGLGAKSALRSLKGNVKFNVQNGILHGIDLPYYIRAGKSLLKKQPLPTKSEAQQTDFGTLTGTGTINRGILSNRDLKLVSPHLEAEGRGTVDLVKERLDYDLEVSTPSEPDTVIPLMIKGPFAKPSVTINAKVLLKEAVKQQIEKQTEKIKTQIQEKLKSVFEGGLFN